VHIRGRVLRVAFGAASVLIGVAAPASARATAPSCAFVTHFDADVPSAVRPAVVAATHIWSQLLVSAVPIEVDVGWGGGLPRGVAAATEPAAYERMRDGSWQPIALANAASGRDLEPGSSDVRLLLGSGIRWYFGTDGAAPADATDMVTMVLHELTHGLGFADSFRIGGGGLTWGRDGAPVGLDAHLFDASTGDLVAAPNASELLSEATSRRVVWRGTARDSHGNAPVMYAPRVYEPSSSLGHFDDDAYPPGDPDALMTSLIRRGEVIHRIGPAALGVLADLGWTVHAEPAAPLRATTATPAAPTTTATPPKTAAPDVVPPDRVVSRRSGVSDFGRTGVAGAETAVPTLVLAAAWHLRRRWSA
jgi:hypothetical protein